MEPLSGVSVNMGGGAGIWNCVGLINYNEPLFINVQGGGGCGVEPCRTNQLLEGRGL